MTLILWSSLLSLCVPSSSITAYSTETDTPIAEDTQLLRNTVETEAAQVKAQLLSVLMKIGFRLAKQTLYTPRALLPPLQPPSCYLLPKHDFPKIMISSLGSLWFSARQAQLCQIHEGEKGSIKTSFLPPQACLSSAPAVPAWNPCQQASLTAHPEHLLSGLE